MRTSRQSVFEKDFNLHSYDVNESCAPKTSTAIDSRVMSDLRQASSVKTTPIKTATDNEEYDWSCLDENSCKSKRKQNSQIRERPRNNFQ